MADLEAQREEKRLETTVRKPADAAAYEKRVNAEGEREARIALAEASKREVELRAEADARQIELRAAATARQTELTATADARQIEQIGAAEASATEARGTAEGKAIEARGVAEATAIAKRAEALATESEAVIGQQGAENLPDIVRAASEAFRGVDNLTVLNGAQGMGELVAQVIGQAAPALDIARQMAGRASDHNGTAKAHADGAAPAPVLAGAVAADGDGRSPGH